MKLETRFGKEIPVMGTPMGAIDISEDDFEAYHPDYPASEGNKPILFGIEVSEDVELTVINEFNQEVTMTFRAFGPLSYLIKKILADENVNATIYYFI